MSECTHCHTPLVDDAVFCPYCGTQVKGAQECEDYTYEAFISYRHLPHDTEVATQIQRRVEGFKIPKDLDGPHAGKKLGRLFRDEDELPTSSSLSDQIRDALKHSRFLLVVCTPQTPESRWVAREVELFSSYHGRDRVLVALAEAEPPESFPELLLHRKIVAPDGTVRLEPTEPLAADFRDKTKYKQESLRIAAALVGCGYDDLRQRQKARRNAHMAKIGAAVAAVSLAFAGFSAYQQAQIVENQRQLQISQSRFLAQEVDDLLAQGNRTQAIQVALTALPESSTSNDRPYVPEAQNALEQALQTYRTADGWYPRYSHTEQADVQMVRVNGEEGLYAVLDQTNTVHVYRIATGKQACVLRLDDRSAEILTESSADLGKPIWQIEFCGPNLVAYENTNVIALCFDPTDGTLLWSYSPTSMQDNDLENMYITAATSTDDGSKVALGQSGLLTDDQYETHYFDGITVLDGQTGKAIAESSFEVDDSGFSSQSNAAFDDSDRYVAATFNNHLALFDLEGEKLTSAETAYKSCEDLTWSGSVLLIASSDYIQSLEDDGDAMSWPCAFQAFDTEGKELWSVSDTLTMLTRGYSFYESDVEFWSNDLDDNGSFSRVLASMGCDLMAIETSTGKMETLNTFPNPICCAITSGDAESRSIHVCTADGTLTFSDLDTQNWGASMTDSSIEAVSFGQFAQPTGNGSDDLGYLVSTPADFNDQRTTTVRTLCSTEGLRGSLGLGSLVNYTFNADRTLIAAQSSSFSADSSPTWKSTPQEPALYVLDASSLELRTTIDGSQISQAGIGEIQRLTFSPNEPDTLLVFGSTDKRESIVGSFDANTGDLQAARICDSGLMESQWNACAGSGTIVTFESGSDNNCIVMLDGRTLEEMTRTECEGLDIFDLAGDTADASSANGGAWSDGKIAAFAPSGGGQATMLDLKAGELVESDLTSYNFASDRVLFHDDGEERFAIGAGDSELACFDLPSGTLRWTCEVPQGSPRFVSASPDGRVAIAQASGSLIAVDAATGTVLGTSTAPVGTVYECSYSKDGSKLYARCQIPEDSFSRCTLEVISLDDPTLTPISSIRYGITISTIGDKVLVDDDSSLRPSVWVMPYLSLDELIAQGRGQTASFELTEQERRTLMIE